MTDKALIGFGGIGGPEIAMREADLETLSIELDPAIAEISRYNGNDVITTDLLAVNPADYIDWLLYHFSPPCPNFSVANHASSESEIDIALARKICEFIRLGRPRYFTLENVWMYRKSLSFLLIWYTLLEAGYGVDAWHLNSADYGVPQSRRRMIVIARRDGQQPAKPWPTHRNQPDMFAQRWRGWYEAIEDLIPGLPETQFAPWQEEAMTDEWHSFIMASANTGANNGNGTIRGGNEPMFTVLANGAEKNAPAKAFIVDCQRNGGKNGLTIRAADGPIFTMTASANHRPIRAGLPSGRIVSMNIRCLARFQDFPDWFVLPGEPDLIDNPILLFEKFWNQRSDRALACRGIGNALPPGMYRAVLKSLGLEGLEAKDGN